ncbi:hypothetical protein K440DRAFT_642068 [Wilcoxina mikolae CBS 423.85]|nr:hypothetical protein K440DRAFT_642068 [Wilcoxina mikolae CBS 423.85]
MAENLEQINRGLMNHTELDPELGQTYSHGFFGRDDLNAIYGGVGFVLHDPHDRPRRPILMFVASSDPMSRSHAEYLEASVGLEQTLEQTLDEEILNVESVGSSVLLESVSKLVSEELSTSEGISAIVPRLSNDDHMEMQYSHPLSSPFFTEPTFAASSVKESSISEDTFDWEGSFTPVESSTIIQRLSQDETQNSSQDPLPCLSEPSGVSGSHSPYDNDVTQPPMMTHQYTVSSNCSGSVETCLPHIGISNPGKIRSDKPNQ